MNNLQKKMFKKIVRFLNVYFSFKDFTYNVCALTLKTRMNVAYCNRHFNISTKTLVPALELALKVSVLQESFRTFSHYLLSSSFLASHATILTCNTIKDVDFYIKYLYPDVLSHPP